MASPAVVKDVVKILLGRVGSICSFYNLAPRLGAILFFIQLEKNKNKSTTCHIELLLKTLLPSVSAGF